MQALGGSIGTYFRWEGNLLCICTPDTPLCRHDRRLVGCDVLNSIKIPSCFAGMRNKRTQFIPL